MYFRDALEESLFDLMNRPARSCLTILGTVLGVGMLVATLGVTASAQRQIDDRFSSLSSTEIDAQRGDGGTAAFDRSSLLRVAKTRGVESVGILEGITDGVTVAVNGLVTDPSIPGSTQGLGVVAVDYHALETVGAALQTGAWLSSAEHARGADVALLGAVAARQLGIDNLAGAPALLLNGKLFAVQGILQSAKHHEELLLSVVVTRESATALLPKSAIRTPTVVVGVQPGYADAVAKILPASLLPSAPSGLTVITPPDARVLRSQVGGDVSGLFLLLAGVGLLVGVLGIASTTLVSVMERTPEIGLRRALGARRAQIASQFLAESSLLGLIGGVVGASAGIITTAAVAIAQGWLPVIHTWTWVAAPVLGLLTGLVAGLQPAARAARVDPMVALTKG